MKYLITLLLAISANLSFAAENIFVVWPWNLGDADAQFSRATMEAINRQQKQYNFVFENKPGAGASLAAIHVARTPNSIMAASSAFFVRPNFYTDGVHDISAFRPLALMCSSPLMIASGKYKSWDEVPKNKPLAIGLAGPGTTSHLVADIVRSRFPDTIVVPYKSTNEPLIDTMAGRLDFAVGFVSGAEQYIDAGKVYGLGVTGTKTVHGIPSLTSKGFANADTIVNNHSWLVPKSMPEAQFKALQALAKTATNTPEVQEEFRKLYCDPRGLTGDAADKWFNASVPFWREQSRKTIANSQ